MRTSCDDGDQLTVGAILGAAAIGEPVQQRAIVVVQDAERLDAKVDLGEQRTPPRIGRPTSSGKPASHGGRPDRRRTRRRCAALQPGKRALPARSVRPAFWRQPLPAKEGWPILRRKRSGCLGRVSWGASASAAWASPPIKCSARRGLSPPRMAIPARSRSYGRQFHRVTRAAGPMWRSSSAQARGCSARRGLPFPHNHAWPRSGRFTGSRALPGTHRHCPSNRQRQHLTGPCRGGLGRRPQGC